MEFILGATIPTLIILLFYKLGISYRKQSKFKISYRQTDVFETLKPALPYLEAIQERPETQSSKYESRNNLKVVMFEDKAYWIKDNSVYVADVVNGGVDPSIAKVVDTMTMDKVQLDRLSIIIDKLTKGNGNDSSNPRFS